MEDGGYVDDALDLGVSAAKDVRQCGVADRCWVRLILEYGPSELDGIDGASCFVSKDVVGCDAAMRL